MGGRRGTGADARSMDARTGVHLPHTARERRPDEHGSSYPVADPAFIHAHTGWVAKAAYPDVPCSAPLAVVANRNGVANVNASPTPSKLPSP